MKKKISALLITTTILASTSTVFAYTDVYTVRPGDTVYRIAKAYNVKVEDIAKANKLKDPHKIWIGEKLYIPVPGKPSTSTNKPSTSVTTPPKNGTGSATTTTPNNNTTTNNNSNTTTNNNNNTTTNNNSNTTSNLKPPSNNVNASIAEQMLALVNAERTKAGVAPLTLSTEVSSVAQVKSDDMAKNGYFDHNSPTYGSPFTMLSDFGVTYRTAGENIAKGQQSTEAVMKAWMNSSGHKANILSPNFKQLGVGYSANNGSPVWVQMFITK